jgi:hypothetical protein
MISKSDFIRILTVNHNLIKKQTEGLSQADTLIQPQPSGNCMNWVLGHALENQVTLLELLGARSPINGETLVAYRRESEPVRDEGEGVLSLERLLEAHEVVHNALIAWLEEMNEGDFSREIQYNERTTTLGWRFLFSYFHYTYHVGQLELLRQLAGRTEKVI